MNEKTKKAVLIVDDDDITCKLLSRRFIYYNERSDCPYTFDVGIAQTAAECIQKVRSKAANNEKYDIIVLDIWMENYRIGLDVNLNFALYEQLGWETPIRIIFTAYSDFGQCVEAIRYGAWDYVRKDDVGNRTGYQIVVESAISRLRQLELRRELEEQITAYWLPEHQWELQQRYGGKLVAIWHKPDIEVIAWGVDAFELEDNLKGWRSEHAAWEQPFIVKVLPAPSDSEEAEG